MFIDGITFLKLNSVYVDLVALVFTHKQVGSSKCLCFFDKSRNSSLVSNFIWQDGGAAGIRDQLWLWFMFFFKSK